MKLHKIIIIAIAASFVLMGNALVFSQEGAMQESNIVQGGAIPDMARGTDTQWLWGEVLNIDTQNKTILVKYLDYDADQEKEISINVDEKTTYENVQSFNDIKPKDALSIDYIVYADGNNVAKNISMENNKTEDSGLKTLQLPEMTPQDMTQDKMEDSSGPQY